MPTEETKKTINLPSKTEAFEPYREWLLSALSDYQYCEDDIFAIHLAVEEAFFNAIKHGNKLDSSKNVTLDFVIGPDKVDITMTDEGDGFEPDSLPDCRKAENLLKVNGRGIFLVRSYMDIVEFNKKGNSIHMIRNKHTAQKHSNA